MPLYDKDRRFLSLLSYTTFFEMPPTFLEHPLPYHVYGQRDPDIQQIILDDHPAPHRDDFKNKVRMAMPSGPF